MSQFLELAKVIIVNSSYFLGDFMFSEMVEPIMDRYLNYYQYDFLMESPIKG
jgi:hypothetical protein